MFDFLDFFWNPTSAIWNSAKFRFSLLTSLVLGVAGSEFAGFNNILGFFFRIILKFHVSDLKFDSVPGLPPSAPPCRARLVLVVLWSCTFPPLFEKSFQMGGEHKKTVNNAHKE